MCTVAHLKECGQLDIFIDWMRKAWSMNGANVEGIIRLCVDNLLWRCMLLDNDVYDREVSHPASCLCFAWGAADWQHNGRTLCCTKLYLLTGVFVLVQPFWLHRLRCHVPARHVVDGIVYSKLQQPR